jgi:nitroreductase
MSPPLEAFRMDHARLAMPIGEAMFTQRSIRRFRPDPIATEDLRLLLEAAVRAPNGGNHQIARFLVVTDRDRIAAFGRLYHEAWWAKRRDDHGWTGPEDVPPEAKNYRAAMELADHMQDVPCVVFAFAGPPGWANSVIPACQNLMLAARALGIGSIPTTLHATVMERFYAMFGIPREVTFHFCIPLGYPGAGAHFGGARRRPTSETTYLDRWGSPPPWTA